MSAISTELAPTPEPTTHRRRELALAVIAAGTLMIILDGSIVTVAMPAIQRDLDFTSSQLSWVVNAYLIAFGSLLLLAGRLGDLLGRKRMFLAGTGVFTAASLLAGAATTPAVLLAARFLQGVGSAMAAAVGLGILVTLFPGRRERARAIAVFSFTGAAGASIGQVLGGVLTDLLSWHWIFFINLPIGAAVIALALPALPADKGIGLRAGADVWGALLITVGLMAGISGVINTTAHGWSSPRTVVPALLGAVLVTGFFVRQSRARTPLMPLRILRSRTVAVANVVQMLMVAALYSFQVLVALYLQGVLGYGAARTGIAMLPAALVIGLVSLGVSARLIARYGERAVLLTGITLLIGVLGLLTRVPERADYAADLLPVMLLAAGFGLALPALTALGMSGAGERDAGLASGLFNTTQQIGMALGVATLSTLAAARTHALTASGSSRTSALTGGYHVAFAAGAGLLLLALVVAFVALRRPGATTEPAPEPIPAPEPAPEPTTAARQPVS
ncbi:MFS transporter [Streptomyces oryzae]|uniref:MFS transporter n=1 Tax=Streptomyces oryzae TaxID=1434886 RepID=A0ABS3XJM9_9ACTN|nr:MFS transporter [Streptomyces oryzae]MBO8195612.1 MFS transporter [Streptomyces oryzae]